MSSRLFDEIREQRGLAYAVYSSPSAYADAGALSVYAGTTPGNVDSVLDLIEVELKQLVADGLSRRRPRGGQGLPHRLVRDGPGGPVEPHGPPRRPARHHRARSGPVAEQVARWQAVDHDDVRRVIERVFGGPRVLAAVGPLTKTSLQRFG